MTTLKRVFCLLICGIFLFCISGCNGSSELNTDALANELTGCFNKDASFILLNDDTVSSHFNFKCDILSNHTVYLGNEDDNYNLIAVVTLKNSSDISVVVDGFSKGIASASQGFKSSNSDVYKKLQSPLFYTVGNTLITVVTDNQDGVIKCLKSHNAVPYK